ncbi:hypothetical protein NC652_034558 [Populus alba x Populus x berolinensis]|nr:hypothetical protein NC652_034558 [Populus alba x Populus x berolinensis]
MLGILPFFRKINLSINNFHDTVPQEIGRLFCLQSLSLNYNSFGGELFRNLSHCSNFGMLNIEKNSFIGKFPTRLPLCQISINFTSTKMISLVLHHDHLGTSLILDFSLLQTTFLKEVYLSNLSISPSWNI